MKPLLVAFDRDNTLIKDTGYFGASDEWLKEFELCDGVVEGLSLLQSVGAKFACITNQAGVARGLFPEERVLEIHSHFKNILREFGIDFGPCFYCPHVPPEYAAAHNLEIPDVYLKICEDRKPGTGLLVKTLRYFGFESVDNVFMYVVGDKEEDVICAKNFRISGVLISNEDLASKQLGYVVRRDFFSACEWIRESYLQIVKGENK
jgi:D-glycero-D-manno-heptose 1,7-bisphosphate phosphatase